MPRASRSRASTFLPFLNAAMEEFAIEPAARAAAFLAQLAHESGQLRFMEEIWGPTPAQLRYEPVTPLSQKLGNTQPGDGKRFKGRGPIQLTGRANYQQFGDLLNVDLVGDPPRAATPEVGFRIAGLFWSRNGLNELADLATAAAFITITKRINGGTAGLAERQAFYAVARTVLGVPEPLAALALERASAAAPRDEPILDRGWEAIRAFAKPPKRRVRRSKSAGKKKRKPRQSETRKKKRHLK